MVILTVATDERAAWNGVMAPFLIGLFIFTAAVTVGPASGGSFNPARSLDPVLFNQEWGDVWIYIVGPLAGGVLGAAIWAFSDAAPAGSGSGARDGAGGRPAKPLAPALREVLVVLHGRPAASPAPADPVECAYEGTALVRHSRAARSSRRTGGSRGATFAPPETYGFSIGLTSIARSVRMVRPARRPLDVAAVEGRRVVGLDRAEVARAVRVDRNHPPDRERAPCRGRGTPGRGHAQRRDGRSAARFGRFPSKPQCDRREQPEVARDATGQPGRHDTPVIRFACAASIRSIVPRNGAGAVARRPGETARRTRAPRRGRSTLLTSRGGQT